MTKVPAKVNKVRKGKELHATIKVFSTVFAKTFWWSKCMKNTQFCHHKNKIAEY